MSKEADTKRFMFLLQKKRTVKEQKEFQQLVQKYSVAKWMMPL